MTTTIKEALCEKIRRSFAGVRLGYGIGLHEARSFVDFVDERPPEHVAEERENWERIPLQPLIPAKLMHMDPEGLRFHLPAFMIAALKSGKAYSPVFSLVDRSAEDACELLTLEQRAVVREFLEYVGRQPEYVAYHSAIERALSGTWR